MKFVKNNRKLAWLLVTAVGVSSPAFAAGPPTPSTIHNPLAQALIVVMVFLALAIAILANVVNGAIAVYRDKMKAEKEAKSSSSLPVSLLIIGMLLSFSSMAQDKAATAAAAVTDTSINGLSTVTFYTMIAVIAVEIIIVIALVYQLKWLMGIEKKNIAAAKGVAVESLSFGASINSWWNKLNKSVSIDREKEIDLSHDYDGIRELDNTIPPWWSLGFIACIIFAGVYLYRYHVVHSAPLQIEELQIAMKNADEEKQAYLKLTASNVDENSVKALDNDGIAAGKTLFTANCVACHGPEGGGLVGPNLTDVYWLHGGDIKSVFKTIKYGWPDKGMKSWKDDFSPVQIAQLASYIESIKGTKPSSAKEPQGVQEGDATAAPANADSSIAAK